MLSDAKKDALGLINWGEFRLNFSNYDEWRPTMKLSDRILERTEFYEDNDVISCKARLLDIREELPEVRKLEAVVEALRTRVGLDEALDALGGEDEPE